MSNHLFPNEAGADLAGDAPGDDRTDLALKARSEGYQASGALQWLLDDAGPEKAQTGSEDALGADNGVFDASRSGLRPSSPLIDPSQIAAPRDPETGALLITVGAPPQNTPQKIGERTVLGDVAKGATESTAQIAGGVADAGNAILDLVDWAQGWTDRLVPLGGVQITDPTTGDFDPRLVGADELAALRASGVKGLQLPTTDAAQSVTGGVIRAAAQFLAPFGVLSKAAGVAGATSTAATFGRSAVAGAATDFLAFDGQEDRLSNLIEEVPALANPVNKYLAADGDDGELEGRLKNAVEGLGLGALAEGLFRGIKAMRQFRRLRRENNADKLTAEAVRLAEDDQFIRAAGDMRLLGDARPGADLVTTKLKAAAREAQAGVPDDIVARSLTARGLTPLDGAGGVYVNFARIDTPEDIQKIIKDASSAFAGEIDGARRGVRSNAATKLAADKVDAWEALMGRREGAPLNAEESLAARQLWAAAADKLGQVAEVASSSPTPENLFQFRRMFATFGAIQKEVIAARTETARALQSWAIPAGGNLERMRQMSDALARSGGAETTAFLARRVAVLSAGENGAAALSRFVDKSLYAKTLGSIQEYWINALLSGPKTHMVNMASNSGVIALAVLERAAAARFGRVFLDETGVEIGEAAAMVAAMRGGVLDGVRNAGKAFRTGQTGFGMNKIELPRERYISSGAWNVRSESWFGRAIDGTGAVVNVPGRMLQAEDEFFKTIGYRMEVHAQAQRMASRELGEGTIDRQGFAARVAEIVDDPPEAIRMEAVATAAYQTFTNPPGKFTQGIQKLISDFPMLRFVMPFTNTPANILKYTFERTPLAPLSAKFRAAMAKGGAEADLALTKMAMGTMFLMYSIDLGLKGQTTGSGPGGGAEKQNWRRQGNQPYSVRFGDKSVAFNRLDPLGYSLGIGADMAEYLINADPDEMTGAEFEEMFAAGVFSIAENVTSKAYMQGASMLLGALQEPDRRASAYIEKFARSFIPTMVGEVGRAIDPVMRASNDIVSAAKSRLPGFSDELPPRRDLWGREIRYESGFGKAYDVISPLYGRTARPEPIDQVMEADGWFIGMGGKTFTIDGERISLRNMPAAKSRYYELRGATKPSEMAAAVLVDRYGDLTLLEVLNAVVTGSHALSERFGEMEDAEDRENFVRRIVARYGRAAKKRLFEEFPEIEEKAATRKRLMRQ